MLESLDRDDFVIGHDVCLSNPGKSRSPKDPKSFLADKISEKISEGNIKGAVRLASSDCSLILPDAETASILREKHPSKARSSNSTDTLSSTTPQYHTDESEVFQAIRSFPNGSGGGGLDGLKPQHLKDMVGTRGREHESRLLQSLTHFVNLVLDGCVPQKIRSTFFGASLCALRKKDGGVRPIAIGNTLRRLISKVAVRGCAETCNNLLRPNQLGFGVRLGADAAVHATRSFIESHCNNTVLLKIDFANAFNSIYHEKFSQLQVNICQA